MRERNTRRKSGRGWKQWTDSEARAALVEWKQSGLSAEAFARSRGFSSMRLAYWAKRLPARAAHGGGEPVKFVAIDVPRSAPAVGAPMHQIEIECAGIRLRVREELDVEHVARLVAALAGVGRAC
jgi:hypothetical protein